MFDYFGSVISYIIIGVPILSGRYGTEALGQIISKNSFIVMYLLNLFTRIIDSFSALSDLASYTTRVAQVMEWCGSYSMGDADGVCRYSGNINVFGHLELKPVLVGTTGIYAWRTCRFVRREGDFWSKV